MTKQEISQMIASIGLPYAYNVFTKQDTPGHPPFILFTYPSSENFSADGKVYQKIVDLNIELYTNTKEPLLEKNVEDVLDAAGLFYDYSEEYIESEKMHMVLWETSVVITE